MENLWKQKTRYRHYLQLSWKAHGKFIWSTMLSNSTLSRLSKSMLSTYNSQVVQIQVVQLNSLQLVLHQGKL